MPYSLLGRLAWKLIKRRARRKRGRSQRGSAGSRVPALVVVAGAAAAALARGLSGERR